MTLSTCRVAYVAEAAFSKTDEYIATLHALEFGIERLALPASGERISALELEEAAQAVSRAEKLFQASAAGAEAPLWHFSIAALGPESTELHPLTWLNLTERKTEHDKRANHEWYLTKEDDGLWLTFEHGKFGYRRERQGSWSGAFYRLAALLAGRVTWHRFGDTQSRRTLLGKGQFYWQATAPEQLIPVDNFVFAMPAGHELCIEGVSHRCVLSLSKSGQSQRFEWHDDYARGLTQMADLIEGSVDVKDFGHLSDDGESPSTEDDSMAVICDLPALARQGKFVVKSIHASNDVHDAPILVYQTREGRQAELATDAARWVVSATGPRGQERSRSFDALDAPDALRLLARVLNGAVPWHKLGSDG